jgi:hypothetical protein
VDPVNSSYGFGVNGKRGSTDIYIYRERGGITVSPRAYKANNFRPLIKFHLLSPLRFVLHFLPLNRKQPNSTRLAGVLLGSKFNDGNSTWMSPAKKSLLGGITLYWDLLFWE